MIPHYQIPRNTLLWLFATQILVLLPHVERTPMWVILLLIFSIGWRIQVFRGHWPFPKKIIKIPIALASVVGLVISFPSFFGLEALVSLLLVAYGLKLLEMYHKRDALILVYLSFFLVMTSFLFDQSIVLAIFNVLVLCVIATALMGLYQEAGYQFPLRTFRHAAIMVLQAFPLMVLMFIFLPRLPSFWNIPLNKNTPKTGMSDSMSPGDFSRLTQSNDPVMRITFKGSIPDQKDLYWRGLTFSAFDGRRWQVDDHLYGKPRDFSSSYMLSTDRPDFIRKIKNFGLTEAPDELLASYEIILEPMNTPWLYALQNSIPETQDIWLNYDDLLAKDGPVTTRYRYNVNSYQSTKINGSLPSWKNLMYTRIPSNSNPHSREMAEKWFRESGTPEAYINKLLALFHNEFYYTLQPPQLGENSVDDFLFNTKKGFCEHFASSFVFMLRAAGIPARVVVGYQGGEINPYEHYLLVKQYDAHAWAEVWLDGKGWVRYDPTFAVAPQRILDGFHESFKNKSELALPLLSLERYRKFSLINTLQQEIDRLNYNWARWVLSYDSERQMDFLSNLFGEYSITRMALIFGALASLFLSVVYLLILWQERDKSADPVVKLYRKFCRKMKRKGFEIQPGEAPRAFLQRIAKSDSESFSGLNEASVILYQYWYQGSIDQRAMGDLRRSLFS